MSIETDVERRQLIADFGVTITRVLGGSFSAATAEVDGETLDGGVNTDGVTELLAVSADVADAGLTEGDSVTISGSTFRASKIDSLADGMDIIHCELV